MINNTNLWCDTLGKGESLLLHHGYTAIRENSVAGRKDFKATLPGGGHRVPRVW
jgi:hypothetical protein